MSENQEGGFAACASNTLQSRGRVYECPVCLDYLLPPIHQCYNGHAICTTCEDKIEKCPICREKLPKGKKIRNLYLEEFVKDLVYECKKKIEGCNVKLKFDELEDHVMDCRFSKLSFCENLKLSCAICCSKDEIMDHLNLHGITGVREWVEGEQWVELHQKYPIGKDLTHVKWSPHFLKFQDHLFFVETQYSGMDESAISWKVMVAGSAKTAKDYFVKMELKATSNSLFETSWTGPVTDFKGKLQPDFSKFKVPLKTLGLFSNRSNAHLSWIIKLKLFKIQHDQPGLSKDLIVLRTEDSYREILLETPSPAHRGRPSTFYDDFETREIFYDRTMPALPTFSERHRGREFFPDTRNQHDSLTSLVRFSFE